MKRFQVYLPEEDISLLGSLERPKVSTSEHIRRAIEEYIVRHSKVRLGSITPSNKEKK